jgi:hypothetical protein
VERGLAWLLKAQNADGSWGDADEVVGSHRYTRVGATAMALLSLLGAGYTHLSRDELGGVKVGPAVARALEWLEKNADGDDLNVSIAALALNEAFGLTGSERHQKSAQALFEKLLERQRPDGSWSGDLLSSLWASESVASAVLSGMPLKAGAVERAVPYLRGEIQAHGDSAAAAGLALLVRDKSDPGLVTARELLRGTPPRWEQQNYAYWYLGSLAAFQIDGPSGATWKAWNEHLKETLVTRQESGGGWPGAGGATAAVVRNGMATLTLEVYYRYANVLK